MCRRLEAAKNLAAEDYGSLLLGNSTTKVARKEKMELVWGEQLESQLG